MLTRMPSFRAVLRDLRWTGWYVMRKQFGAHKSLLKLLLKTSRSWFSDHEFQDLVCWSLAFMSLCTIVAFPSSTSCKYVSKVRPLQPGYKSSVIR